MAFSPLPDSVLLGVRRQALDAVAASLPSPSLKPGGATDTLDKPLGERERVTLLTIIDALAHEIGIDISMPSKAGSIIEALTDKLGARVSARTIENHLKRIQDARERRGKISN